MRLTGLGQVALALGLAALGVLIVVTPDFSTQAWRVAPKWMPLRVEISTLFGAILVACGLGLLIPRTARLTAIALAGVFLVRWLILQVPQVAAHPLNELTWFDLSENLALIAGAWIVFSMAPGEGRVLANLGNVRLGQVLFALSLPAFGLSHFLFVNMTAPLIPAWLPFHLALAYLTGAAHIAAGLAILFGVLPRLAATLEAAMMSLFTVIIWVPMIVAGTASHGNWAEICISTALSGAAWLVAGSLSERPWGLARSG